MITWRTNPEGRTCASTGLQKSQARREQTEEAVRAKLVKELNIPEETVPEETSRHISTERAYSVRGSGAANTRMVVVKFEKYKEKELQAARENRPKGLYVNES